jgi:hypothetical protein
VEFTTLLQKGNIKRQLEAKLQHSTSNSGTLEQIDLILEYISVTYVIARTRQLRPSVSILYVSNIILSPYGAWSWMLRVMSQMNTYHVLISAIQSNCKYVQKLTCLLLL